MPKCSNDERSILGFSSPLNEIIFRDRSARTKRSLEATVTSLQTSLELTKERMEKDDEWKGMTDADLKKILEEKRELLTKYVHYI